MDKESVTSNLQTNRITVTQIKNLTRDYTLFIKILSR